MRPGVLVLTLLGGAGLLALWGCGAAGDLVVLDPSGPSVAREERAPGTYRLKRPTTPQTQDQSFYIQYRGYAGARVLQLLSPEGEVIARRELIDSPEGSARLLVPLAPRRSISRIAIRPAPAPGLTIEALGLATTQGGLKTAGGVATVGPQILSWRGDGRGWEVELAPAAAPATGRAPGGGPAWRLELLLECRPAVSWARFRAAEALARTAAHPAGQGALRLGDLYRGPERFAAVITVSGGQQQRRFLFQSLQGDRSLVLYPSVLPPAPRYVRVEPLGDSRVWLTELALVPGDEPQAASASPQAPLPGPLDPLPADPGVILLYDPLHWRSRGYELYRWSRFPRVLIFDTADYDVQDRYFKRLAFFVEKRGYRGRLVTDREVEGRHGFNAHDYRAEDLAAFFQQAADRRFPLHDEEVQLRTILLVNGVLGLDQGRYVPGLGAVISISRGSGPLLRRHLLTHEAFHGAFFASESYGRSCLKLWDELNPPEREFWLLFFRWMGYDTADPYLAANELQAYLFQQERREVGPFFRGVTAGRLLASYPGRREDILGFLSADPGAFERRFDALEERLIESVGLEGGRIVGLSELDGP